MTGRFVCNSERAMIALSHWLHERNYNEFTDVLKDRFGNRMIGLSWRDGPGQRLDRGVVLVKDPELYDRAIEKVKRCKIPG